MSNMIGTKIAPVVILLLRATDCASAAARMHLGRSYVQAKAKRNVTQASNCVLCDDCEARATEGG